MSDAAAMVAAAIAVGESNGNVIEVDGPDGADDEEGRLTRLFKTNREHVRHVRNIVEKQNRST